MRVVCTSKVRNSKEAAVVEAKEKTGVGVGGPKQPKMHQPGYRSSPDRNRNNDVIVKTERCFT